MEIWLDTTDNETIRKANELNILHGITTNPTLVSESGLSLEDLLEQLLDLQDGPVAVQVVAENQSEILRQAELLTAHSPRVIVKVPVTQAGLPIISQLSSQNIAVMATAIFDPYQALLAFKAGAHYLAPYIGRMTDAGLAADEMLGSMQLMKQNYNFEGKIIAAGIRDIDFVIYCAEIGIAAVTLNKKNFALLIEEHTGTKEALANFQENWKEAKKSELF